MENKQEDTPQIVRELSRSLATVTQRLLRYEDENGHVRSEWCNNTVGGQRIELARLRSARLEQELVGALDLLEQATINTCLASQKVEAAVLGRVAKVDGGGATARKMREGLKKKEGDSS